jgi:hypothetical protein
MSLINDALKRAKAKQDKESTSAAGPLQFRQVDPSAKPAKPLPWTMILIAGAGVLIIFVLVKALGGGGDPLKVEAKGVNATGSATTNDPTPLAASTKAVLPPAPKPTTLQPRTQDVVAAISAPIDPGKMAPRLQGLFYSRVHPSALINGKTVLVGDKVGEAQVTDIGRSSVTLVTGTHTNVLSLEE